MNMFKTTTAKTPEEYISRLEEPWKSQIQQLHQLIRKTLPALKPLIISGMIGYGKYPYKSKSGKPGEWARILLASQKHYMSVYVCGVDGNEYVAEKHKKDLPKADIGKSCIRIKKLEDVDLNVLKKVLIEGSKNPIGLV